jgi:transaldolase
MYVLGVAQSDIPINIYLDSASSQEIFKFYSNAQIPVSGFTTNPSLMKSAGVTNYLSFVEEVTKKIPDLPISFEVLSDDLIEMKRQALKLSSIAPNVYVKIPVVNTKNQSTAKIVGELNKDGVKLNITAIFSKSQVLEHLECIENKTDIVFSVFSGRISDTGVNAMNVVSEIKSLCESYSNVQLLWASTRELYNIVQAIESGCNIITITSPILEKMTLLNKNLIDYSLETVKMFLDDAESSGYSF